MFASLAAVAYEKNFKHLQLQRIPTSLCGLLVLHVLVVSGNILLYLNFMYTSFPPSGPGKTQLISENIS